ncbi:hypothetical protein O181_045084 [Austropuccinia psidii MF-1]|uniref:Uncharacterized protein n=1 Tax=Austropuccinia psidii MF-1 TaxID=1389203 RepID=A0A9Q3DLA8_9BASI|nr:hypothetical protein [Austropuccinia psidii MF-1]
MICSVFDLNLDLKMSSNLTSICDSNHSDSPASVLYGAGVFDNLREFFEESMAPTEIYYINETYYGFKSVRAIEPPCINCQKKVNKTVVTSLSAEVDALTEVFVDKAMKSSVPGEPTRALAREEVAYEYVLVVKFREALRKF